MENLPEHSPLGASGAEHQHQFVKHPDLNIGACSCGTVWNFGINRIAKQRLDTDGYCIFNANKKTLKVHRIILEVFEGFSPFEVDHIDRNRSHNSLDNLRYVTSSANHRNVGVRETSSSGIRCVRFRKDRNNWQAYTTIDGKFKHLGIYPTSEEAELAAKEFYDGAS